MMSDGKAPKLTIEALEERIAPTVIAPGTAFTWTDSNGDQIQVSYEGPAGSQVDVLDTGGGAIGAGDDIGSIEITNSDVNSALSVMVTGGAGPGDVPIGGNGGIFTTSAGTDLGALILGVDASASPAGWVTLATCEGISIGGELRALAMSGDIDFDLGDNFVWVGGDLGGVFFLSDMVLDSGTGLADIAAGGTGGLGDIGSMGIQGDVLDSTGGAVVTPQTMAGTTPLIIADDVDDGTTGSLRLQLSGPAATADVVAVPVTGGGSVLVGVNLYGEGTGLTVTAQRAGGDVGYIWGNQMALGDITIRGAADTDVAAVTNWGGSLGTVANRTAGGDFLVVSTSCGGDLEAVTTTTSGKIGALYRGTASDPLSLGVLDGWVGANGDLGLLSTGSLVSVNVTVVGNFAECRAGTVMYAHIEVGGDLGLLRSDLVYDSELEVAGMLEEVQLGARGMLNTDVQAIGGIGLFNSRGAIVECDIASLFDTGSALVGGMIEEFRAPEMHSVEVEVLGGFGTVNVSGVVSNTEFDSWHADPYLAIDVGGGIEVFRIGGMSNSDLDVLTDAGELRIGRGGQVDDSDIDIGGNLGTYQNQGDMSDDSDLDVDGDLTGSLRVRGDMLDYSDIDIGGSATTLQVNGNLLDSSIDIGGDVDQVRTGDLLDDHAELDIGGNAGRVQVGSLVVGGGIDIGGNVDTLTVVNASEGSDVDIEGSAGTIRVIGCFAESDIEVAGDAGRIVIHEWLEGNNIDVDGNLDFVSIRNPIDGDSSDLDVGGDLGTARLPSLTEFDVNVGGSAGEILVRGGVSDLDVDVDGDLTELVVTRGASDLEVDVDGNATSIQVSGGGEDLDVWVGGILDEFLLRGSLVDSDVEAESGITSFTVTDVLADSDVDTTHYDGVGDPIGAGIGTFRVNEMRNVDVETHTDITEFVVRGAVTDSDVDTRAYDNYGGGSLVGGGGIAEFRALGLYDGDVHTFGAITEMRIGRGGVDMDTEIDTADAATGHLVLLQTPGFIFGDIQIAGDVTDVLTGGADALPGSAPVDFLFVDNHSVPTLGTLEVDGAILGTVS